jgi:hypothetical protein
MRDIAGVVAATTRYGRRYDDAPRVAIHSEEIGPVSLGGMKKIERKTPDRQYLIKLDMGPKCGPDSYPETLKYAPFGPFIRCLHLLKLLHQLSKSKTIFRSVSARRSGDFYFLM